MYLKMFSTEILQKCTWWTLNHNIYSIYLDENISEVPQTCTKSETVAHTLYTHCIQILVLWQISFKQRCVNIELRTFKTTFGIKTVTDKSTHEVHWIATEHFKWSKYNFVTISVLSKFVYFQKYEHLCSTFIANTVKKRFKIHSTVNWLEQSGVLHYLSVVKGNK